MNPVITFFSIVIAALKLLCNFNLFGQLERYDAMLIQEAGMKLLALPLSCKQEFRWPTVSSSFYLSPLFPHVHLFYAAHL